MSEIQSNIEREASYAEPYPSFAALRDAHRELLKSDREMTDRPAFLDKVEQFCERAHATGTLLNLDDDRRASQSLLNYWVTTLYGDDRTPPNTILADFDPSLIPRIDDAACPYPGSRAFGEDDAKNFFGRQTATDYILSRLKVDRLLALVGPSGRGKTSLTLAGILPALRVSDNLSGRKRFYFPFLIPGSDPVGSLAGMIKGSGKDSSDGVQDPIKSFLRNSNYILEVIKKTTDLPVVIVVDQFDDLFTLCNDKKQQRAFLANLVKVVQAPEPKHTVIITMRSDSYDNQIKKLSREFIQIFEPAKWTLPPLGADEIGDAIRKPADKVGLRFQESTVLSLIKEILSEPIGLPLLQFALQKLWAKREVNTIPDKLLKELGGCRIAFVRAADRLYKELKPEEQLTARRILMRAVKVDDEGKVIDIPVLRLELLKSDKRERIDSVLQRMIKEGLVRLTENKEEDVQVELVHDSLIRSWTEMAAWVGTKKSRQSVFKYAAGAVLALVILAGAVVILSAVLLWRENEKRKLSHFFARQSNELLKTRRPNLALLLGLHANRIADDAETRGSILNALWQTPRPIKFLYKENYAAGDLALSSDQKRLATLDDKGRVSIWDLDREPSVETELPSSVSASYPLVFSPDGKTLAWASSVPYEHNEPMPDPQSNITLWDLAAGTARTLFIDADYAVNSMAFSPDNGILISGGNDGRVFRWDLARNRPDQQPFIRFSGAVRTISFDPQGKLLASGSSDGRTILWDVNNWRRVRIFDQRRKERKQAAAVESVQPEETWFVSFSPDSKMLSVDGSTETVIWDVATGEERHRFSNPSPNLLISAFSGDGQTLTSYSQDGNVFVWDLVNDRRVGAQLYTAVAALDTFALSSDARILALPSENGITLWDLASNRPLVVATDDINAVAFNPTSDSKMLAAGVNDGRIILWDTVTRKRIRELGQASEQVRAVTRLAFSADGKTLAAGLFNGAMLWDVTNGAPLGELSKSEGTLLNLALSPDGKTLAAIINKSGAETNDQSTLVFWDVETRQNWSIGEGANGVASIAFSNNNKTLVTGHSDGNTVFWNVADRKRIGNLPKQDAAVLSVSFDPSGKRLATGNSEGTVRIWDVSKLDDLSRSNQVGDAAVISGGTIFQIVFSPDGKTLAFLINPDYSDIKTGINQGGVILWDIETGRQVGDALRGHDGKVLSVAFRSDGKMLASGSTDRTIILWDMDVDSAKEQICRIANVNLSREEWNTFVGEDKKYCRICSNIPAGKGAPQDAPACKYTRWSLLW